MKIGIGDRFGRLIVLNRVPLKNKPPKYKCKCDCGVVKNIDKSSIARGLTKSCGCLLSEVTTSKNTKHGLSGEPLFKVYHAMKQRCFNKDNKGYHNYGGRGITVCTD